MLAITFADFPQADRPTGHTPTPFPYPPSTLTRQSRYRLFPVEGVAVVAGTVACR